MITSKKCTFCKIVKPLTNYYKCVSKRLGVQPVCIPCSRTYQKKFRLAPHRRRDVSIAKCRHINREWSIPLEEYLALIKLPCHYCGFPIELTGTGLDRLDNSKGYTTDNVVTCCWVCNRARANYFTPKEMKDEIGKSIRAVKLARSVAVKSI